MSRTLALSIAVCLSIAPCLVGCDPAPGTDAGMLDDAGDAPLTDVPADTSGPVSVLVRAADGGRVTSADGIYTLVIPAGALAADTEITITRVPDASIPASERGTWSSPAYDVQPEGTVFTIDAYGWWHLSSLPPGVPAGAVPFFEGVAISAAGDVEGPLTVATSLDLDTGAFDIFDAIQHLSVHFARFHIGPEAESHASLEATFPSTPQRVGIPFAVPTSISDIGNLAGMPLQIQAMSDASASVRPLVFRDGTATTQSLADGIGGIVAAMLSASLSGYEVTRTLPSLPLVNLDPPPQFGCTRAGSGTAWVIAVLPRRELFYPLATLHQSVDCVDDPTVVERRDAILVASTFSLSRYDDGETVGLTAVGGTAGFAVNVVHAHDDVLADFRDLDATTSIYEHVPVFRSNEGPEEFTFQIVNQSFGSPEAVAASGTATYDGTRYVVSGFTGPAADYGEMGRLRVTATPPGATDPVIHDVFPLSRRFEAPAAFAFGPLAGLATEFRVPDGSWGFAYVLVTATGGAGESGVLRLVPRADMALVGGERVMPILPASAIAALADGGLTASEVYVGLVDQEEEPAYFPGLRPIPIQAGWLYRIAAPDFAAPVPPAYARVECSALPATLAAIDGVSGVVCLDDADAFCFVTNDTLEDAPGSGRQCLGTDRAAFFHPTGSLCSYGPEWELAWSANGSADGFCTAEGTGEARAILERSSDGARREVRITPGTSSFEVTTVAPWTGPLPPYGARSDCAAAPRTFPATLDGFSSYATVCMDEARCALVGDHGASPESNDGCTVPGGVALEMGGPASGSPYVFAGGLVWSLISTSHGTLDPRAVSDFPPDTSVTVESTNGTITVRATFRYVSATDEIVIESITAL